MNFEMRICRARWSFGQIGGRVFRIALQSGILSRQLCSQKSDVDYDGNGFGPIEGLLGGRQEFLDVDRLSDEFRIGGDEEYISKNLSSKRRFLENCWSDADNAFEVLRQDGPGFDVSLALSESNIRVSGIFVRGVLLKILRIINHADKTWCAKLAQKFFTWSSQQEGYVETGNSYHLLMEIFGEAGEFKAMWRLVDEMTEKGYPTTARTLNILLCACGEAGLARKIVEKFIMSKTFNYRPFKHAYVAILHSLLAMNQYKLIEWVYEQMLGKGYSPDVFAYNIIMWAKHRLGKFDHFQQLFDEMGRNGHSPDFHTYNILLHILGKGNKPLAALKLLNHMKEVDVRPCVLHFTTLIDGLSKAGNLNACRFFFDEMINGGAKPDVVCYTVMITGYASAGELDVAQQLFDDMILNGHLPNVHTYNSMIRGLCKAGKFEEACSMLKGMEGRGCSPNFLVYNTLVSNLRSAGKLSEAHDIIRHMMQKGDYAHLLSKFKRYRGL